MGVSFEGEQVTEVPSNGGEVHDCAIVHEDVAAEDEGMAIQLADGAAAGLSNMGEETVRFGI